jgi:hypothetical protein
VRRGVRVFCICESREAQDFPFETVSGDGSVAADLQNQLQRVHGKLMRFIS